MLFRAALLLALPALISGLAAPRALKIPELSEVPTRVDARAVPVFMLPVSTACYAKPRAGSSTTSLCNVKGHLNNPPLPFYEDINVIAQRCENDCICRADACLAFSWTETQPLQGRGHCRLYGETLQQMGFTATDDYMNERYFWSRTCFHKAVPTPSAIHTHHPQPTPSHYPRSLEDHVVAAMVGL